MVVFKTPKCTSHLGIGLVLDVTFIVMMLALASLGGWLGIRVAIRALKNRSKHTV